MSEISLISDMKEILTECQLCHKQFNETTRVPRRMPCCVEPVCEPCLTPLYNSGRLTCPLCHKLHTGYKGIQNLPVEQLILKLLAHPGKTPNPPCTYCPLNNMAIAKCGHCSVLMCQACLKTHSKNKLLKDHRVIMFEEIRYHRSSGPGSLSRTLSVQSMNLLSQMKEKRDRLNMQQQDLEEIQRNLNMSRKKATEQINKYFDDLARELRQRRSYLLSQVESRVEEETAMISRVMDTQKSLYGRLKKFTNSAKTRKSLSTVDTWDLLSENPDSVDFKRKAVSFVPCNGEHLTSIIHALGMVRTVTFSHAERPEGVPDAVMYNNIHLDPAETPDVSDGDSGFVSHSSVNEEQTCNLGDQLVSVENGNSPLTLFCPYLEWDMSTASRTITTSESIITNAKPEIPLSNTGCRIQAERHAIAAKPLLMRNGQRVLYQLKLSYALKMEIQENKMLFEAALTDTPIESSWNQPNGLSLNVASCSHHKRQLCLRVVYDNQLLEDVPIAQNEVGVSRGLHLGFLLNSAKNAIHVLDIEDVKVMASVTDADLDRPLWVMMMLSWPSWANMAVAMVSGTRARITNDINKLLASLE